MWSGRFSWFCGWWCAMGDAEDDLFQKAEADLPQDTAAVVPIANVYAIFRARQPANLFQDDKMGRKAASELIVIFFVQVGIVDIEIGGSRLQALGQVRKEVRCVGSDEIGAAGFYRP